MKTITTFFSKGSTLVMLASMFFFASCSRETAYVSQYDKLAYEQTIAPTVNEDMALAPVEINPAETNEELAAAPMLSTKELNTVKTPVKKSKAITAFNKAKEKGTKKLNNISAEKIASVSLLASAAKDSNKSMLDGKLRIGIILLLVGLLVGIFFGFLGYIISVIGVVFIVLWLIEQI